MKSTVETKNISVIMPKELHNRVLRRAAQETIDYDKRITVSNIIRAALEEYLDAWEGATFVKEEETK